jgi:hypothetical protein
VASTDWGKEGVKTSYFNANLPPEIILISSWYY